MAYKISSSLIAQLFVLTILLALSGQAMAGRAIAHDDVKQPEWLFHKDPSVLIPGIGRVMVPPGFGHGHGHTMPNMPTIPDIGDTGGAGSGSGSGAGTGRSYVPGGDDTLTPNPGYEVPNPGSGGSVPAPSRP